MTSRWREAYVGTDLWLVCWGQGRTGSNGGALLASLVQPASLTAQVLLIARLRWTIFRNKLRQRNATLELIGLILTGLVFAGFILRPGGGLSAAALFLVRARRSPL